MARRTAQPKEVKPYRYSSIAECEDPTNATQGYHLARPAKWPPTKRGNPDGSMALTCELCACNLIVYEENDPEQSSIKLILPAEVKQKKTA